MDRGQGHVGRHGEAGQAQRVAGGTAHLYTDGVYDRGETRAAGLQPVSPLRQAGEAETPLLVGLPDEGSRCQVDLHTIERLKRCVKTRDEPRHRPYRLEVVGEGIERVGVGCVVEAATAEQDAQAENQAEQAHGAEESPQPVGKGFAGTGPGFFTGASIVVSTKAS